MTRVRLQTTAAAAIALLAFVLPSAAAAKGGDRDHDRMPDRWERKHGLNAGTNDARLDRDRDGLRNLSEHRARTNPSKADSDGDGVRDGDEDRDRDRVDNANEERERTHPSKKDSDRDGTRDGSEDADRDGLDNHGEDVTGMDPIDPDSDDDGVKDGAEDAGTVESFKDGLLVLRLAGGGSVSGLVTGETEIECDSEDEHESWDGGDDDTRNNRVLDVVGHRSHEDQGDDLSFDDDKYGDEDDEDWGWDDDSDAEDCGAEALVPGAVVHEAELDLLGVGAVFSKIELVE